MTWYDNKLSTSLNGGKGEDALLGSKHLAGI